MLDIDKLLRKELRTRKILDPGKPIFLLAEPETERRVAELLLRNIFPRSTIRVVSTSRKRKNLFRATSLEREIVQGLRCLLEDEQGPSAGIAIMASIPEELLHAFARRQSIPVLEEPPDDVRLLLERLQRVQPQTKAGLRKSFAYLGQHAKNQG